MKMLLITLILMLGICISTTAQTHYTLNNEKCWVIKKITDAVDSTYLIVVIDEEDPEDRKKIEKILMSKKDVEKKLLVAGYRVEIYMKKDVTPIKR